jgi:O-antigen/teichoic acid export membrane protein
MAAEAESFARSLVRSAAQFSAGQVVAMFASVARVALAARYLSPEQNGVWIALQLVLSYGANLHLGSVFGVFRSVPLLRAQGKTEEAMAEERTSFSFTALMALLGIAPLYFITARACPAASTRHVVGTVGLVSLQLVRSYYNAIFKAENRFAELAKAMAWGGIVSLPALVLIRRFGLDGVIACTALQGAIETALLARRGRLHRPYIDRRVLAQQIRVGFMTLLTSIGVLLLTTVDRTVMLQRLGSQATGAYYIGANVMVLMPVIAALPAAVLTPQFFARVGTGEDLRPLIERPVQVAAYVFAALVAFGSVLVVPAIATFWPKLVGGGPAAQAALFATYPLVLAGLVTNVYYAHDRQGLHVVILLASGAISLGLAHLGVSLTHTITGAAIGAAAGLFLYYVIATGGAYYILGHTRSGFVLALRAMLPLLYAGTASLLVEWTLRRLAGEASVLSRGLGGAFLVGILTIPIIVLARKRLKSGLGA